jgi:hypothetical protein
MVVFDGKFNGYRDLILPLAHEDDVVRRAVLAVAANHLSLRVPELKSDAQAGYQSIITRLCKDSTSKTDSNEVLSLSAWATVIVLLVGETATVGNGFPYLFKMLLCLAEANAKSQRNSVLQSFLREQTRMYVSTFPRRSSASNVASLESQDGAFWPSSTRGSNGHKSPKHPIRSLFRLHLQFPDLSTWA